MVDAVGLDNFKIILDKNFNVTDEAISGILGGYKDSNPELFESVNTNLITMAGDLEYYKQISETVLASTETVTDSAPTAATEPTDAIPTESDPVITPVITTDADPASKPVEDPAAEPVNDSQTTDQAPEGETIDVIEDGLKFNTDPSNNAWDGGSVKSSCTDVMSKEVLGEGDLKKMIDEVFAIARCYDAQKCWKLPHHDVAVSGSSVSVTLNEGGLRAAANALLGARQTVIATGEEKKAAASHLRKHFDELGIEAPDNLVKVSENSKFADLVIDSDLVLALDDDFVKKIIDEDTKIKSDIDTEAEVNKVLDAIYIVMRPFVNDGAKITVSEDLFKKLAQSINGSAIGIAAVLNGEGNDVMKLDDNAIVSTMRSQINSLKDELTDTKDQALLATNERNELRTKVADYETKIEAMGKLSADVNAATALVEEVSSINNQKLNFLFANRTIVDEDIFREIVGAKTTDQLANIGKWVTKMGNKKVTLTNMFSDKVDLETTQPNKDTVVTTESGLLNPPVVDKKNNDIIDDDAAIKNILSLITS